MAAKTPRPAATGQWGDEATEEEINSSVSRPQESGGQTPECQSAAKDGGGVPTLSDNHATEQPGCDLATYAEAVGLPEEFLSELGLSNISVNSTPAVTIPYLDYEGIERTSRHCLSFGEPPRWRWKSGAKPMSYGLSRLREHDYTIIVSREYEAQILWHHGLPGLAVPTIAAWDLTAFEWGFRALRSLIPVIAINESSDCDRPSERSDVRVWLVQFSFSGC